MEKVLIIVPAFNEEDNIEKLVDNLEKNYPQYDYVVINDGSTDHTAEICLRNHYQFISLPINLGIGGAVQTGYQYALDHQYDIAIQIDGDGQHNLSFIEELVKPIREGSADIAIGSRFITKEGFQSSFSRRVGIQFLSGLIRLLCGKRIRDVTSGYRAVNRRFIRIYAKDYPNDYPEPEAIIAAVMYRGTITEVPVVMNERESGISSINFKRSVYYMVKVTLAILVCRISFGIRR